MRQPRFQRGADAQKSLISKTSDKIIQKYEQQPMGAVLMNFDDDQWFLLSSTPASIGALMSAAEPSGAIGTMKELSASMSATVRGLQTHGSSELVVALLDRSDNWSDAAERAADYRDRTQSRFQDANITTQEGLKKLVLDDCRAAAALVDEHCVEREASAYKDWCVLIATKVAQASKEGSILGFGGSRVSDAESATLLEIEQALGISAGKLLSMSNPT